MEKRKLLSPCNIAAEDASHLAVEDLRFALEQGNSRNIAVTGNYGAGKSSVVNTCISEMGIDDKVLRISMSTYSLAEGENIAANNLYSDDIEYKIVQHLLCKTDKTKIPYSRFQPIRHIERDGLTKYVRLTMLAIVCYIIAFEPSVLKIESFCDAYHWFLDLFGKEVGKWVNVVVDGIAIVYLIWFLQKAGAFIAVKLSKFKNVKIEANGVSMEASTEVSVFNRYLEEILYIIQANKYDYILFEDLDRMENSAKLFLKIRELNMLLNESEVFKKTNRRVKFIYAIRDDVFTRELRTKCFDYIVAVMPVVDHYNVTDYLIKEYKQKGLFKTIDIAILAQLTRGISGLRELKNVVNEYTLYENSLKTHLCQDVENYEEKLLAIIVYKNLFPQDFAKIYQKMGLLYTVLNNKSLFCDGLTKELADKSVKAKADMNEARKKIIATRRQYLEKLNEEVTVDCLIKDGYDYTLDEVADKDNLFESFIHDEFDEYSYHDHNNEYSGTAAYEFEFEKIQNKVTEDMGYYEAISDAQIKYNRSNEERIKAEREIKTIENTSFGELFRNIGNARAKEIITQCCKNVYDKGVINKEMVETLQTFLYGGFISEDYYLYISKFYEGSLSERDYQFTNAVLQGKERPYNQKISNVAEVVGKLSVKDFKEKSILNYDVANYLLEKKEEHYLIPFVETARKNPDFIVCYYQSGEKVNNQLFKRVFDGWDSCVTIIKRQEKGEYRETLLKLMFMEAPVNIKLTDAETKYLESRYAFISENLSELNLNKMKEFVQKYDLVFETLVKPNVSSKEFYEYCLTHKRFLLVKKNLDVIFGPDFDKKPITLILRLQNERLKKHLENYLKDIIPMLGEPCNDEERSALVYVMCEDIADAKWKVEYIGKQQYIFDDVSDLDRKSLSLLLRADKILPMWDLIIEAFKIIGELSDDLNSFITHHVSVLSEERCVGDSTILSSLHRQLFMGESQTLDEFKLLLRSFDMSFTLEELKDVSDERILEVIKQKKIEANSEVFKYMYENCTEKVTDNYLILRFDDLLDDEGVDWSVITRNSLGVHVLESRLTLQQKKRFMDGYLNLTKGHDNAWELAKLICFYYEQCGVQDAKKELVIDALKVYNDTDGWDLKIRLINKCNDTWTYHLETENKMLKALGGEYDKLTYARGWANFDINENNTRLLEYLKAEGHYISKIDPKNGQYHVTFKHS